MLLKAVASWCLESSGLVIRGGQKLEGSKAVSENQSEVASPVVWQRLTCRDKQLKTALTVLSGQCRNVQRSPFKIRGLGVRKKADVLLGVCARPYVKLATLLRCTALSVL